MDIQITTKDKEATASRLTKNAWSSAALFIQHFPALTSTLTPSGQQHIDGPHFVFNWNYET